MRREATALLGPAPWAASRPIQGTVYGFRHGWRPGGRLVRGDGKARGRPTSPSVCGPCLGTIRSCEAWIWSRSAARRRPSSACSSTAATRPRPLLLSQLLLSLSIQRPPCLPAALSPVSCLIPNICTGLCVPAGRPAGASLSRVGGAAAEPRSRPAVGAARQQQRCVYQSPAVALCTAIPGRAPRG